jgi:uncharacterized protein (DUF1800 family)
MVNRLTNAQVVHAFNRFGLGGRPDDTIPTDPVEWLTAQLTGPDPLANAPPPVSYGLNLEYKARKVHGHQGNAEQKHLMSFFLTERETIVDAAIATATPFRERLVWFWANHFAVQAGSDTTYGVAGCFVREAIRPYVLDTFENMLVAAITHPAMLCSLNNDVSMGPQSPLALQQGFGGINENLARETMELFTIGLQGGFTQADVDALAYILTGWTVGYKSPEIGFLVDADMHQPGPQTMLGVTYPGTVFDGYQALQYLATQPSTYTLLATKLVTHFVSDTPDPDDVATVTQALSGSGGSLPAAYNAIIGLSNAWVPQTKLRTPVDLVLATGRALAASSNIRKKTTDGIGGLGQQLWQPPFPNGWSDLAQDWCSGSQMELRTNFIDDYVKEFSQVDPIATANTALGALISPATTAMMARVHRTHDKLTILFCSPDFQRR